MYPWFDINYEEVIMENVQFGQYGNIIFMGIMQFHHLTWR
jgi:hypothetical protein